EQSLRALYAGDDPGRLTGGCPDKLERQIITCVERPERLLSPSRSGSTMDGHCSKCGMQVSLPWKFCSHCGTAIAHESHPIKREHHAARGGFGGMFYG